MSGKETCLADLRARILSTDLAPGLSLDEAGLADRYGLSRTPLREVLQRLAGEGYVALQDHRGAKVASMDLATMRTFFQTAPMIYAAVGRLAAEHRTEAQLRQLKAAQQEFVAATKGGEAGAGAAALANHRFHATIGEMAANIYLGASLGRLLIDHTRLSQTFYRPRSSEELRRVARATEQHDAMIAAIAAREPGVVVDLTLQHWDLSRDRLEEFVRPDPLPLDLAALKENADAV